jgi:GNAT superfamily N-acetyltransferase
MSEYFISDDKALLDLEFVVRSLGGTYWAAHRPREVIVASLQASLCLGAYDALTKQQVGLARVVTDGATFSWLCDVYVAPEHRRRGLGKQLVAAVLAEPRVARTTTYLGTKDAHGLYERYGFQRWELMRRPAGTGS